MEIPAQIEIWIRAGLGTLFMRVGFFTGALAIAQFASAGVVTFTSSVGSASAGSASYDTHTFVLRDSFPQPDSLRLRSALARLLTIAINPYVEKGRCDKPNFGHYRKPQGFYPLHAPGSHRRSAVRRRAIN